MADNSQSTIPAEVYLGFIRSLFHDNSPLLIAAFSHAVVGMLVYWNTSKVVYIGLAALMVVASLLRYRVMQRVKPQDIRTTDDAKRLEQVYISWGSLHSASVGLFAFYCIREQAHLFAELAAIAMTLGSAMTIGSRNFGSRRMVLILCTLALVPVSLGLILKGDFYNVALGLMIVPLMFTIDKMAGFSREILFTAITEEKKATFVARKFDRALNTMRHGLLMLDRDGHIAVANARAVALFGTRTSEALLGRSIDAIMMRVHAAGLIDLAEGRRVVSQLGRLLREGHDQKVSIRLRDGRNFEMSANEGRFDLGVITFEDVTKRVEAAEHIRHMARFDQLTGLPNRGYFQELVDEKLLDGDPARTTALAIIDLDDFKRVNDALGHSVGDGLIYEVGKRISSVVKDGVVCRFGGDEFVIYYDRVADQDQLRQLQEKINQELSRDFLIAGKRLHIAASGGAVLVRASLFNTDDVTVKADLALHTAKRDGKNRWQVFEESIDQAFRKKLRLIEDLRTAITERKLTVVYQPIIDAKTMRISGCEALCRWQHSELGPIGPADFIPLAEESGMIIELSAFVLSEACTQCTTLPEHLTVSVNLSANDFKNGDAVRRVKQALAKSGLAPRRLVIEITEGVLIDDKSAAREQINELRAMGVKIALDDFGTGYSTLSYLHQLPIDKIKIDKSFVDDLLSNERSVQLLLGIITLCHSIGASVTIEGVETHEQLSVISSISEPDELQGYLFGAPLSSSGIETMASAMIPLAPISNEKATLAENARMVAAR